MCCIYFKEPLQLHDRDSILALYDCDLPTLDFREFELGGRGELKGEIRIEGTVWGSIIAYREICSNTRHIGLRNHTHWAKK